MALPNSINSATPAGSDSPSQGDDQIRAFKLAVEDILGIPDNTSITQAAFDIDAGGLAQAIFYDVAATPASGELGRNGSPLYYRITDARTATVLRAFGIIADTSGAAAAGIGTGILFQAESADEAPSDFGALDFAASDIGAGSEDTYASIALRVGGRALDEKYRFASTAGDGFMLTQTHAVTADRTATWPDASGEVPVTGYLGGGVTVLTSGNVTTMSGTMATITGLAVTITKRHADTKLIIGGVWAQSNDGGVSIEGDIFDGTNYLFGSGVSTSPGFSMAAGELALLSYHRLLTGYAAGSWTFTAKFRSNGAATTTAYCNTDRKATIYAYEIP